MCETSIFLAVCWWLKKGRGQWGPVHVFSSGCWQKGRPASKSSYQLPPLFLHWHLFSCLRRTWRHGAEQDVWSGRVKGEPANSGWPGRMAVKLDVYVFIVETPDRTVALPASLCYHHITLMASFLLTEKWKFVKQWLICHMSNFTFSPSSSSISWYMVSSFHDILNVLV